MSADVDLFIVADDEAIARATFDRVYDHLITRIRLGMHKHRQLLILRTALAVSFYAGHPQRTIQLILRRHSCVADVIFGFDVDACQLAYDGKTVLATPSALRAYQTGSTRPERSHRRENVSSGSAASRSPYLDEIDRAQSGTERIFTYIGQSSLRHLTLSAGGDIPTYQVGTGDRRAAKASRSLRTRR